MGTMAAPPHYALWHVLSQLVEQVEWSLSWQPHHETAQAEQTVLQPRKEKLWYCINF